MRHYMYRSLRHFTVGLVFLFVLFLAQNATAQGHGDSRERFLAKTKAAQDRLLSAFKEAISEVSTLDNTSEIRTILKERDAFMANGTLPKHNKLFLATIEYKRSVKS